MYFYLVYRGPLSSTQGKRGKRKAERIAIRKQITPQLIRLWETSRTLTKMQWDARVPDKGTHVLGVGHSPLHEYHEDPPKYPIQQGFEDLTAPIDRKGVKFRPLVRSSMDLTCSLEILFLRQEDPGSLLKEAGDLDNRIKTFIDALEMPQEELEGDEGNDVNYVLLENDTLVRGITIDSERLLMPDQDFPNQVHLVVKVKIHVERVGSWNICLL
ncbi:hypothetical protein [Consotaella aegiceratis]|uniref:hypothetical protein n=1 Tax=Consotaella aegiceratis TaxID=3097961 RepID=UPI002F3F14C0